VSNHPLCFNLSCPLQVCNHPLLSFPADLSEGTAMLEQCGKLALLDRLLVKFHSTGHRVLLFW